MLAQAAHVELPAQNIDVFSVSWLWAAFAPWTLTNLVWRQRSCLYTEWKGFVYKHAFLRMGIEVIFQSGDGKMERPPWRPGGDQDPLRGEHKYRCSWDTVALKWGSSQNERGIKRKCLLATGLLLTPPSRLLLPGWSSASRICWVGSGWAIRAFSACEGPWQEPAGRMGVSLAMLCPGAPWHTCHRQGPRPPKEGGNGKAFGHPVTHLHLLGQLYGHTDTE